MPDLTLPHGSLPLPDFLPDATRGVVRGADSRDLEACGVLGLVMNTYHLMQNPGSAVIQALGGLHAMSGWRRPIITDSGGFQIYSLIHENPKFGSLTNKGATFHIEGSDRKFNLTPEKSVQLQFAYGTDIVICLDDCTHVDASYEIQARSVQRTISWARRCKAEYSRLVEQKRLEEAQRPQIFGVIQGGGYPELRKECANALLEIGFDGFGYGGWPLDRQGNLLVEMLTLTRALIPLEYPLHALGVAHPENVVACARLGYQLFDGAMPTRDARHGRLYAFREEPAQSRLEGDWFSFIYVLDEKHARASLPLSPYCDCPVCTRYPAGYVRHLFKIGDNLAPRLATLHNLRFMSMLMERLREM